MSLSITKQRTTPGSGRTPGRKRFERHVVPMQGFSACRSPTSVTVARGAHALKQFNADLIVLRRWIQSFQDTEVPVDVVGYIQDGVVLCQIAIAMGATLRRFKKSHLSIIRMNNVSMFLGAMELMGMTMGFEPADLVSDNNIPLVVRSLLSSAHINVPAVSPAVNRVRSPLRVTVVQERPRTPRMTTPKKRGSILSPMSQKMKPPLSTFSPTMTDSVNLRVEERAREHRVYSPLKGDQLDECLASHLDELCKENPAIEKMLKSTPIIRQSEGLYRFRGTRLKLAVSPGGSGVQVRRGGGFQPLLMYLNRRAGVRKRPVKDENNSSPALLKFDSYEMFAALPKKNASPRARRRL